MRHWHRRLGITAAAFIVWLAISGIALNEGTFLGLDQIKVGGRFIAMFYGLSDRAPRTGYTDGRHWLVPGASDVLLDGHLIQPSLSHVTGFVSTGKTLFVGFDEGIVVLTLDGQLVETLRAPTLPVAQLRRIRLNHDRRIVIQGERSYVSTDAETWSEIAAADTVTWSKAIELPADQSDLAAAALRPQFPLSRVLADAHSGRLFGRYGHWVVDAVGLAALLLAMTGGWIYLRAVRRQHQ